MKAFLETVDDKDLISNKIEVQFNPTSLALSLTNNTDSPRSKGLQASQYVGQSAAELTLELVFDTADEGTSVRDKTVIVERYLLPTKDKEAPPRLRFTWGEFIIVGKVDQLSLDFDLFAASGVPLRAKAKLSLREQDPKWAREPTNPPVAPAPGGDNAAATGATTVDKHANRVVQALAGETPPEFAARVGLDAAAWRGLDAPLGENLTLAAGAPIGFRADLSVSPGIGVRAGVSAGLDATLAASLGLQGALGGLALAAAGGVDAALATAAEAQQTAAVKAARAAFAAPSAVVAPATVDRTPLRIRGARPAALAVQPASPDPRATSFGRGVPLRDRFRDDLRDRPDTRRDPTRPPWEQHSPTPSAAPSGAPTCRCACACRCQERR
ncbi:hypothetical protein [Nannocystis sp.]|uniref:CIS tube protein n=1 Tax=Nannocystis sp. TaxID=1962667 RepID=UPI0024254F0E|nr:hypothetical protein [Nannocystis sp.]MBK7823663.1 hypothetical protein [Nannocystis sp.]MBK9755825.1 hypothetical protein [Nannocystis sp.]